MPTLRRLFRGRRPTPLRFVTRVVLGGGAWGALLVLGCSAPAGTSRPSMDASPSEEDAGSSAGHRDAAREPLPDVGPRVFLDAGCDTTIPLEAEIVGDPPDLLLVVDRSGSMASPLNPAAIFGGGETKWRVMDDALEALTLDYEARIRFGLMVFPVGECGAGRVVAEMMPRNAMRVARELDGRAARLDSGATPTHTTIDAARAHFASILPNPVGRYALLATDGLPNCGPTSEDSTVDETVSALEALRSDGVTTYVLGFGGIAVGNVDALRRMAQAGGTSNFYQASSPETLAGALDRIAAEILPPSCTVELGGEARDPALLRVEVDGMLVPRDPSRTRGWEYDAATNTISFAGGDCALLERSGNIAVDFGCPGPLI